MGSDPQTYLQDQHDRDFGDVERMLERIYSFLEKVNHVHLPDATILRASEVWDLLQKVKRR
jgi:hypothetical protein